MVPGTSYCRPGLSNRQILHSMLSSAKICPELSTFLEVCLLGFVSKPALKDAAAEADVLGGTGNVRSFFAYSIASIS